MNRKRTKIKQTDVYGIPKSRSKYNFDAEYDKIYRRHYEQNRRIRKSRKEIVKPDLDEIMEVEIGKS